MRNQAPAHPTEALAVQLIQLCGRLAERHPGAFDEAMKLACEVGTVTGRILDAEARQQGLRERAHVRR